jgi:transcriptional regulator with XRE-family HTH domain
MTQYAKRISELRKITGRTQNQMASLLEMSDMSFFDLESHDDEIIRAAHPLKTIRALADSLGVTVYDLLKEDDLQLSSFKPIPYSELVKLVERNIVEQGLSIEQYEDKIGWHLTAFFQSENLFLNDYTIEFLGELAKQLKLDWLRLFPEKQMAA